MANDVAERELRFPEFNPTYYEFSFTPKMLILRLQTEHQRAIDNCHRFNPSQLDFKAHRLEYEQGLGLGCGQCSIIDAFLFVEALLEFCAGERR